MGVEVEPDKEGLQGLPAGKLRAPFAADQWGHGTATKSAQTAFCTDFLTNWPSPCPALLLKPGPPNFPRQGSYVPLRPRPEGKHFRIGASLGTVAPQKHTTLFSVP